MRSPVAALPPGLQRARLRGLDGDEWTEETVSREKDMHGVPFFLCFG